ncbi:MAG TPA: LemA family protein [Balneolaceae bacterium]|nr:LemA family protein [Balneolaceae bacterium]
MNYKTVIGIAVIVILVIMGVSSYNNLVTQQETVDQAWAQVENQYQRRADLVPNLVNTVKGAADFEKSTLTDVVEARSKATSIQISADDLTEENIQRFQKAQKQLSGALSRLMVTVERYPQLQANQNFLALQDQLEGTENRITTARMRFNRSAQEYNTSIQRFPTNIFAGLFSFEKKAYFEAEAGAAKAPEVQF